MAKSYLKNIWEGTTVYLLGVIFSRPLSLLSTVIIVRYLLSPGEWGSLSLSLYVIALVTTIGGFGLPGGTTRFISFHKGRGDYRKVRETIFSALGITSVLGAAFFSFLFLFSGTIASFFNKPKLALTIKILAITILVRNVTNILVSIFRGHKNVRVQALFQSIFPEAIRLILALFAIILGLGFYGIVYIYIIYPIVVLVSLIIYSITRLKQSSRLVSSYHNPEYYKTGTELLRFSLPLLLVISMWLFLDILGPLMLGYFIEDEQVVGVYRTTWILAKYIPWILSSIIFIYLPVVTDLHSKKKNYEIQEIYSILTKWAFMISFSIFILLFLYPEVILSLLFGDTYTSGATALRILSFGYIIHVIFGFNGTTLTAIGKTQIMGISSTFVILLNFILNLVLIPKLGINGASLATAISYIVVNITFSIVLFKIIKINPFTKNYLKVLVTSIVLTIPLFWLTNLLFSAAIWRISFFLLFLWGISFFVLYYIKGFEENDRMFLKFLIEKLKGTQGRVKGIFFPQGKQ